MNNNLPNLKEQGFIYKIKYFFKNLFLKNKVNTIENQEKNISQIIDTEYKTELKTDIKVNVDNKLFKQEQERNELFEKIRNHPELLQNLSNEQLETLSDFYAKKIEINNNIIQEKKEKLKRLQQAS